MYVNLLFKRDHMSKMTGRIFRAGRTYPNQPEGAANLLIRRGIAQRVEPDVSVQPSTEQRARRRTRKPD